MEVISFEERVENVKRMSPKVLASLSVGLFICYQIFIFTIWESYPQHQMLINRWSWSSADAIGLAGLIIGNYGYWKAYDMTAPEETVFLKSIMQSIKRAGMTPDGLTLVFELMAGKNVTRLNGILKAINEGKMTREEAIESLRS